MIEKNILKNLKLGMLQVMSEKLCLQVPKKTRKSKSAIFETTERLIQKLQLSAVRDVMLQSLTI
jgi:hypothetical protein